MPFKDAVDHLDEAVGSVLAQTWRDLELVLVDDGGTDGSHLVAERLRAADPDRVRVVHHPDRCNRGIGPSRALGIRSAAGSLTAFLDADDVWEPRHLEHAVHLLQDHPAADAVFGRAWTWRSWADPAASDVLSDLAFAPGAVVPGTRLLTAVLRHGGFATPTCSVVATTAGLRSCVEHLELFAGMYEDQVMNSVLQLHCTAVMSGATTAWYRQHPASTTVREQALAPAERRWDVGRERFLQWLAAQPELARGGGAPEVRALVDRELTALGARTAGRASAARPLLRGPRGAPALRAAAALRAALSSRWHRSAPGAAALRTAAGQARAGRLERVLLRFGTDLRGRVLLVGAVTLPVELPAAVGQVAHRADVEAGPVAGPHHRLADLPDAGFDCVVVLGGARSQAALRSTLGHVRRVAAPGAALLVELPPQQEGCVAVAQAALGPDPVLVWDEHRGGPARAPLRIARAVIPLRSP